MDMEEFLEDLWAVPSVDGVGGVVKNEFIFANNTPLTPHKSLDVVFVGYEEGEGLYDFSSQDDNTQYSFSSSQYLDNFSSNYFPEQLQDEWIDRSQDVSLLESFVDEAERMGSVGEFLSLVEDAQPSQTNEARPTSLKNPMEIARELQREAEEFEARQSRSPSMEMMADSGSVNAESSVYGASSDGSSPSSGRESPLPPVISIPYDEVPEEMGEIYSRNQATFQLDHRGMLLAPSKAQKREAKVTAAGGGRVGKGGRRGSPKERKKAQNREAATRYRIKRKDERGIVMKEVEVLEQRHSVLEKAVRDKEQEIAYIKGLMNEVRGAR